MATDLNQVYQQKLKELAPNVIPQDKAAAIKKGIAVMSTIQLYLKGNGPQLQISIKLFNFFSKRVEQRLKDFNKKMAA
jgi:hypothetical protein